MPIWENPLCMRLQCLNPTVNLYSELSYMIVNVLRMHIFILICEPQPVMREPQGVLSKVKFFCLLLNLIFHI